MGISNLVNAVQGDSSRSNSRLARAGRQRTFILKKEDDNLKLIKDDSSSTISTKDEPEASTSKQEERRIKSARVMGLSKFANLNKFQSIDKEDEMNRWKEESTDEISSGVRAKLKSRFKRISVDENLNKNKDQQQEFNQIKSKVNSRLDKTYSWKNRLISIVTGREKMDNTLITYQNEYEFFTRPSKALKQPNKLENLLNNQLRNYLESNHNLYYPSIKKANMLITYPNLDEQLKNSIQQTKLPLNEKFTQRILIEKNENLKEKHLNFILKKRNEIFELSTNLEQDYLIETSAQHETSDITNRPLSSNQSTLTQSITDEFHIQSINLRFLSHKYSTKEMNLSSEIISNLEFINELEANDCIGKLSNKIEKLKEIVETIESCVQELTINEQSADEYRNIQKTSENLIKKYLSLLKFLYLERDELVRRLRTTLFNLLKNWKEINSLKGDQGGLRLTFEEQNQLDHNEQVILNSMIEERLEIEKKIAQFNKPNAQLNQRLKSMFNRLVKSSESHENLIESQEDEETMYLNIKNKAILLDGRLPGEPRFFNFQLTYEHGNDSGNVSDETTREETTTNDKAIKVDKLKKRKYLIQIYNNNNRLVYETQENELDQNLQITFTDLKFKEILMFEHSITCNLIQMKRKRKKVLSKLELNIHNILVQTHLHNNTNFSVKADFSVKSMTGELVLYLSKSLKSDRLKDSLENRNLPEKTERSTTENSTTLSMNNERMENLFAIKYDFNDQKSGRFDFKEMGESERVLFLVRMKNEIYSQQELNNLLSLIKRNYRNNQNDQADISTGKLDPVDLFHFKPVELNQRMILLKERNEDEELDKRRIPLYDSHYLSFLIKDKQQVKTKSNYLPIELNQTNSNVDLLKAYDKKKKAVIDYLIDVRKKFINPTNTWNKDSKNYEDYVYEEIDTSLSTLNFDFLFFTKESQRPLRPNRKERKKYSGQSLVQQLNTKATIQAKSNQTEKVKIMINVMSGMNIPIRKSPNQIKENAATDVSSSQQQLTPNYANFTKRLNELFYDEMHSYNSLDSVISKNIAIDLSLKEQKVWPFVEVSFQDQTARTSIAESSQPAWNETIKLDLDVPNDDYSPVNLLKIDDFIYLNLFDHVEVIKDDEIELEKTFQTGNSSAKKFTKNWLGSVSIPFITLYLNSKIEGTFCVQKPTYLTDYDFETKPTFSLLNTGHNQELDSSYFNNLSSKKNSYLTLFLTIDPQLNLPNKIEFKCSTDEDTVIYNYVKDWQSQMNKKYPNRLIKSLVINLVNGKHTLATRFLSPLQPPAEFLNTEQYNESNKDYKILMKNLARYVSLIPTISNELASSGLIEEMIWADCEQFLKMKIGSVEEHAILLCNYFLYLGLNSGLVLGTSVPEGKKTCYVIVWFNDLSKRDDSFLNVQLWHPVSGQCYFVHADNFLPFTSADCIITKENVYASLQKEEHPNQISFNILKANCWRPLFNLGKMKVNLNSIQPNKFDYELINENYARNLEQQIEVYLKESLMKWRRQKKTFFNRFCTKEVKKELAQMEYKTCYLKDSIDPNDEINKILSTYKINGLQLNLPFNGIDQLTQLIYSTGIHLTNDDKVDFVIAVHLHAYPQSVYSMWIYCAHIHTR